MASQLSKIHDFVRSVLGRGSSLDSTIKDQVQSAARRLERNYNFAYMHKTWKTLMDVGYVWLNGTDEYYHINDTAVLDFTDKLTIRGTLYTPSVFAAAHILDKAGAVDGYRFDFTAAGKAIFGTDSGGNYVTTNTALSADTKYDFMIFFDNGIIDIYFNNVLYATTATGTIPAALTANAVNLGIGATAAGGSPFRGRLYQLSLDTSQSREPVAAADSVAYWTFDGSGADSGPNSLTLTEEGIDSTNYVTSYSRELALPNSRVKAVDMVRYVDVNDSNYKIIVRVDPQDIIDNDAAYPRAYWMKGSTTLMFDAVPEESFEVELHYYEYTEWSQADTFSMWLIENAEDLLEYESIVKMGIYLAHQDLIAHYAAARDEAWHDVIIADNGLQRSGRDPVMNYTPTHLRN